MTQQLIDEIDLMDVFAKLIISIKRNLVYFIIAFVLGTGAGACYFLMKPKTYESKMIVTSDILTENYSKALFESIDFFLKEHNYQALGAIFHLPEDQLQSINKIELRGTIEKGGDLKEQEKTHITFTVQTTDNTIWPELQKSIVDYLETNEFVKARIDQRKRYYKDMIQKIDLELRDLETLKARIMDGKISAGRQDGMIFIDPTSVNSKILDLNKERINYQHALALSNSVQIIKGFAIFQHPVGPGLSVSLLAGSSLGIFFVFVLMVFKSVRKIVRIAEEKLEKI